MSIYLSYQGYSSRLIKIHLVNVDSYAPIFQLQRIIPLRDVRTFIFIPILLPILYYMPKFCVSIFTESERIINSQIFNQPNIGELEKGIKKMLFELTFDKPFSETKGNQGSLVQEMSKENIKWYYFTFEKRSKIIKYFVILEQYQSKK
jgi:hypothetical protein